jgi:hypothetical protein
MGKDTAIDALSEGSRDNGANVIQYEWLDSDEQKFKLEEV